MSSYWSRYYLDVLGLEMNRLDRQLSDDALAMLKAYKWSENVCELSSVVKRMLAISKRKVLSLEDVPSDTKLRWLASATARRSVSFGVRKTECLSSSNTMT